MLAPAFTWESYRRSDGSLDLVAALLVREPVNAPAHLRRKARDFLLDVEDMSPIRNVEGASVALAYALTIVNGER